MKIIKTKIEGLLLIEPDIFGDKRGFFCETYSERRYGEAGITAKFVQDNISKSAKGVIRGLHYQISPHQQSKLVSVIEGRIYDVVVDIRRNSPTFGKWEAFILEGPMKNQLFIPAGFAHGLCVISESATISYKCDNIYSPPHERGIIWNDPVIGIDWPIKNVILSDKDKVYPTLKIQKDLF